MNTTLNKIQLDTKIPINDDRLTSDLRRIRNGNKSEFQLRGKEVFSLQPPQRAWYAELIDGQWYWINGCPECVGEEPVYAYVKCDKHNVCIRCHKSRKEMGNEIAWGHRNGFICNTCMQAERRATMLAAFLRAEEEELDDTDHWNEDKIICPHCFSEASSDDIHESETGVECQVCEGSFSVEVEYTPRYTTSVEGERKTLASEFPEYCKSEEEVDV